MMAFPEVFQLDYHFDLCNLLESLQLLVLGPGSWHTQLILVRTCAGRDGGVHAARARGAERGAALAQVDLHRGAQRARRVAQREPLAPVAAHVVDAATPRAVDAGPLRGRQGELLPPKAAAAALVPGERAPRRSVGGGGTCGDHMGAIGGAAKGAKSAPGHGVQLLEVRTQCINWHWHAHFMGANRSSWDIQP